MRCFILIVLSMGAMAEASIEVSVDPLMLDPMLKSLTCEFADGSKLETLQVDPVHRRIKVRLEGSGFPQEFWAFFEDFSRLPDRPRQTITLWFTRSMVGNGSLRFPPNAIKPSVDCEQLVSGEVQIQYWINTKADCVVVLEPNSPSSPSSSGGLHILLP